MRRGGSRGAGAGAAEGRGRGRGGFTNQTWRPSPAPDTAAGTAGPPPAAAFQAFGADLAARQTPAEWDAELPGAPVASTSFLTPQVAARPGKAERGGVISAAPEMSEEDADSRRQRFEATLPSNKFHQMNAQRDAQRAEFIRQGLLPDPEKRTHLDQALTIQGLCEDMCPEFEREQREAQNNVDVLERYPGTKRIDPARAVKQYHRPSAGEEAPLPTDIRTPGALVRSLDYLFNQLLPKHPFEVTHPFIRDRTRSIRAELTIIRARGDIAIGLQERIARWHLLALGVMRGRQGYNESQELEQLRKVLLTLQELYDDAKRQMPPIPTPNEPEFRAYALLTHLRDPDIAWATEQLPSHIFNAPLLQIALSLHSLAQQSDERRGEVSSLNAWTLFFKLLASDRVPYLFACLLSTWFDDIRLAALRAMRKAFIPQHRYFAVPDLTKAIGCEDDMETMAICEACGLNFAEEVDAHGNPLVELHRQVEIKTVTLPVRSPVRLVEGKRKGRPFQQVIDSTGGPTSFVAQHGAQPPQEPRPTFQVPNPPAAKAAPPQLSAPLSQFPTLKPMDALPNPFSSPLVTPPSTKALVNPFAPAKTPLPPSVLSPAATPFRPQPATVGPPASTFQQPSLPRPAAATDPPVRPSFNAAPQPEKIAATVPKTPSPTRVAATKVRERPTPAAPPVRVPSVQRQLMIESVVQRIARDVTEAAIEYGLGRACEAALADHWREARESAQAARKRAVTEASTTLADAVLSKALVLATAEVAHSAVVEQRALRLAFSAWQEAKRWKDRQGAQSRGRVEKLLKTVSKVEARSVGVMDVDVDFDLSSLSLDSVAARSRTENPRAVDRQLAQQMEQLQQRREDLWAAETLLTALASRFEPLLDRDERWSFLISVESKTEVFSLWLARKFGMDTGSYAVQRDLKGGKSILGQLLSSGETAGREIVKSVGLLLFDLWDGNGNVSAEVLAAQHRARLAQLSAAVKARSRYDPFVLILANDSSDDDDKIARSLGLTAPSSSIRYAVVRFDSDLSSTEVRFASAIARTLSKPGKKRAVVVDLSVDDEEVATPRPTPTMSAKDRRKRKASNSPREALAHDKKKANLEGSAANGGAIQLNGNYKLKHKASVGGLGALTALMKETKDLLGPSL